MRRERRCHHLLDHGLRGVVLVPHAALFLHHVAFGQEVLGVQKEVLHAVRLEVHGDLEAVGREVLEVRRVVLAREGVVIAAVPLHDLGELLGTVFLRPLEHHVLQEMRHAGLAEPFVPRPDPVPDLEGDHRRLVLFLEQDLQTVGQDRLRDLHLLAKAQG